MYKRIEDIFINQDIKRSFNGLFINIDSCSKATEETKFPKRFETEDKPAESVERKKAKTEF